MHQSSSSVRPAVDHKCKYISLSLNTHTLAHASARLRVSEWPFVCSPPRLIHHPTNIQTNTHTRRVRRVCVQHEGVRVRSARTHSSNTGPSPSRPVQLSVYTANKQSVSDVTATPTHTHTHRSPPHARSSPPSLALLCCGCGMQKKTTNKPTNRHPHTHIQNESMRTIHTLFCAELRRRFKRKPDTLTPTNTHINSMTHGGHTHTQFKPGSAVVVAVVQTQRTTHNTTHSDHSSAQGRGMHKKQPPRHIMNDLPDGAALVLVLVSVCVCVL